MSYISVGIIFVGALVAFGFQLLKNIQLSSLAKGISEKKYERVVQIADMPMTKRVLGDYTCDLYKIRAYYLGKDVENFEHMLEHMIATTYKNVENKKSFLELYFHTFLLKENQKYAAQLLEGIRAIGDEKFTLYNEQAYEVMINKNHDLIDIMDEQIESKHYYGFSLGVILYMMAKQYDYLENEEMAALYYLNSKVCFHPKAIYIPYVKENLKRLSKYVENQDVIKV